MALEPESTFHYQRQRLFTIHGRVIRLWWRSIKRSAFLDGVRFAFQRTRDADILAILHESPDIVIASQTHAYRCIRRKTQ